MFSHRITESILHYISIVFLKYSTERSPPVQRMNIFVFTLIVIFIFYHFILSFLARTVTVQCCFVSLTIMFKKRQDMLFTSSWMILLSIIEFRLGRNFTKFMTECWHYITSMKTKVEMHNEQMPRTNKRQTFHFHTRTCLNNVIALPAKKKVYEVSKYLASFIAYNLSHSLLVGNKPLSLHLFQQACRFIKPLFL